MTQYTFWLYIRTQMRLAIILSLLARARATQKRKAKPLKIRSNRVNLVHISKNVPYVCHMCANSKSDLIFSFSRSFWTYKVPYMVWSYIDGGPPPIVRNAVRPFTFASYITQFRKYVIGCVWLMGGPPPEIFIFPRTIQSSLYIQNDLENENIKSDFDFYPFL